jgi:uncharacterized protein
VTRPADAGGFRLEVARLRRRNGDRREVHVEGHIPELFITASRVPEGALVVLDGVLESVPGGVLLTATVTAPFEGECRRCLDRATGTLESEVVELVTDLPDPETGYLIEGDHLDVRAIVHDACILELPLAPLCREGCLGLCPICGVNRNLEQCSCQPPTDPRWAALAGLAGDEMTEKADTPAGRDQGARRDQAP